MSLLKREVPTTTPPVVREQSVHAGTVTVEIKIDDDNTAKIAISVFGGGGYWVSPNDLRELANLFNEVADETENLRRIQG